MISLQTITCGICGKEGTQTRLIGIGSKMCSECFTLFSKAITPIVSITGFAHPDIGTYWHDSNHKAIHIWEEHMRKCGWVYKNRRWRKAFS